MFGSAKYAFLEELRREISGTLINRLKSLKRDVPNDGTIDKLAIEETAAILDDYSRILDDTLQKLERLSSGRVYNIMTMMDIKDGKRRVQ